MAQTIAQLEEQLSAVRQAINAALTGQRYLIKDGETTRELERQSLDSLRRMESDLSLQISRLSGGGVRYGVYLG